jgi:hypothetical protein
MNMITYKNIRKYTQIYGETNMSFANLKRNRSDLSSLVEKANETLNGGGQNNSKDDRFWYPQRDKAGNGYAVVRFLPGLDAEALHHGYVIGITPLKVQLVNGISKSL